MIFLNIFRVTTGSSVRVPAYSADHQLAIVTSLTIVHLDGDFIFEFIQASRDAYRSGGFVFDPLIADREIPIRISYAFGLSRGREARQSRFFILLPFHLVLPRIETTL